MNALALQKPKIPQPQPNDPLADIEASFPLQERWYAFYSSIRAETLAGASIAALGYQTFIPLERRIRRVPGKITRPYECALFPRYGFVRFDMNDFRWGLILAAKGVIDLVRSNNIPRAIDEGVIAQLSLAFNLGLFDKTKPPRSGIEVEVVAGPFEGFIGRIRRARSDEYVDVLLDAIFGSQRTVTVPLALLREV